MPEARLEPPTTPPSATRRALVIVADDDPLFRDTTVALLVKAGYDADGVDTADAVLARVTDSTVDVLITDVDMPGAQGLGYLRPLIDNEPNAPSVLIATAYPSVHSARVAFRLSAVDYLPKPFARSELLDAVARAVDQRDARALLTEVEAKVHSVYDELGELRQKLRSGAGDGVASTPATPARGIRRPPPTALGAAPPEDGVSIPGVDLSPREREIVGLLRQGLRGSEIAGALDLSPNTIRNHFKSIFRKAGVHSQVGLLALFRNT